MEKDLIDNELVQTKRNYTWTHFLWWERRQILFNILNLAVILGVVLFYQQIFPDNTILNRMRNDFSSRSLYYLLFINFCYFMGWGVALFAHHAFKLSPESKVLRIVLFSIGTLFTMYVTFIGYSSYLGVLRYY